MLTKPIKRLIFKHNTHFNTLTPAQGSVLVCVGFCNKEYHVSFLKNKTIYMPGFIEIDVTI